MSLNDGMPNQMAIGSDALFTEIGTFEGSPDGEVDNGLVGSKIIFDKTNREFYIANSVSPGSNYTIMTGLA